MKPVRIRFDDLVQHPDGGSHSRDIDVCNIKVSVDGYMLYLEGSSRTLGIPLAKVKHIVYQKTPESSEQETGAEDPGRDSKAVESKNKTKRRRRSVSKTKAVRKVPGKT